MGCLLFQFYHAVLMWICDIYPTADMRPDLTVTVFGMLGQFYMVAVIGIIISRFQLQPLSKNNIKNDSLVHNPWTSASWSSYKNSFFVDFLP